MSGKLKEMLMKESLSRTESDYEGVMDDFVAFAGGHRVDRTFEIPEGRKNVDYYFDFGEFDCLLELKQTRAYEKDKTVSAYFNRLIAAGRLRPPLDIGPGSRMTIGPDSLSRSEWLRFYKKFRPSVLEHLDKANNQLRDTDIWLERRRPWRIKAAFILNSNDYNLPTDLLARIIEYKVKLEWRMARFRNLDVTMCAAIDMHREGEHPLHSHRLVRTKDDPHQHHVAWYLFDQWIRYSAAELDLHVEFTPTPDVDTEPEYKEVSAPYAGKRVLRPQPEAPAAPHADDGHSSLQSKRAE